MAEKVLVCGGRAFEDRATVDTTLDGLYRQIRFAALIEGGARGADRLARQWAERNAIPVHTVKAKWELHGKAAGPLRNLKMLKLEPTVVVAFPGGKGTADMVARAHAANIEVIEVIATAASGKPSVAARGDTNG